MVCLKVAGNSFFWISLWLDFFPRSSDSFVSNGQINVTRFVFFRLVDGFRISNSYFWGVSSFEKRNPLVLFMLLLERFDQFLSSLAETLLDLDFLTFPQWSLPAFSQDLFFKLLGGHIWLAAREAYSITPCFFLAS